MATCNYCMKKIKDDARFCPFCGKDRQASPRPHHLQPVSAPDERNRGGNGTDKKDKTILFMITGVIVLVIIMIVLIVMLSKKSTTKETTEAETTAQTSAAELHDSYSLPDYFQLSISDTLVSLPVTIGELRAMGWITEWEYSETRTSDESKLIGLLEQDGIAETSMVYNYYGWAVMIHLQVTLPKDFDGDLDTLLVKSITIYSGDANSPGVSYNGQKLTLGTTADEIVDTLGEPDKVEDAYDPDYVIQDFQHYIYYGRNCSMLIFSVSSYDGKLGIIELTYSME